MSFQPLKKKFNQPPEEAVDIFFKAIERGDNIHVAQYVDKYGIEATHKETDKHWPAFYVAAREGHKETVALLCEKGCDINRKTRICDYTPLMLALINTEKAVRILLDCGADPNKQDEESGITLLMYAVRGKQSGPTAWLLEKGADVNTVDAEGNTALIHAARTGRADIAALLLEKDADTQKKNTEGHTALSMAEACESPTVVAVIKRWEALKMERQHAAELEEITRTIMGGLRTPLRLPRPFRPPT